MVSINTNIAAYSAQGNIAKASGAAASSIARLSSGNRIVKASDDVSALAAGTSLQTQVTTLRTALGNASQGTSLLQVADGSLAQISDILQRQKAIAIQAGSGSLSDTDRGFLNQEFQSLVSQIDQISGSSNFNNVNLLNGGLGTKTQLVQLDATAAFLTPSSASLNTTAPNAADASYAIEAINDNDGTALSASGTPASAGEAALVTDSTGTTPLADAAFNSVNSAVYGKFSSFKLSNVVYGVAATLTGTINGVDFTGTVADGDTTAVLSNGSTHIMLGLSAITLTDDGTTTISQQQISQDMKDTVFMHTSTVQGVNFDGTRLHDVIGANAGIAMVRLADPTHADISNFRYDSNGGAADSNNLSVNVNGTTFSATGVKDKIDDGDTLVFESSDGQELQIDFTGLTSAGVGTANTTVNDIRNSLTDRSDFINALNTGFSRAGSGLNFAIGGQSGDNIRVQLSSASSASLYNGQTLSVDSAVNAAAASTAIDGAISTVTGLRATVGALESRFNFASANIQTSLQNQDAARGALLDTDVAAESTAYATSQVQLQAGIAVLAQANQLPQNLLKLIA